MKSSNNRGDKAPSGYFCYQINFPVAGNVLYLIELAKSVPWEPQNYPACLKYLLLLITPSSIYLYAILLPN